jgi:anti-sigma regulatory factor (Ser/Thr protein kinase)
LEQVIAFLDEHLEAMDCPMKAQMQLDVAVEEIYVNIAHYAYGEGTGDAVIRLEEQDADVIITFFDCGVPFNPLEWGDVDVEAKAESEQIGGLGIYMVKKSMDEVTYAYEDGQNVLTLRKHLEA